MVVGKIDIEKTNLETIEPFRVMFLHENNFQFVMDKCHYYGWCDDYLFKLNNEIIGYGCVWGTDKREDRDTIFEFFLMPPYRNWATRIFSAFINIAKPLNIECQSNDLQLAALLYEFSSEIKTESILFEEDETTQLQIADVSFTRKTETEDNPVHFDGYYLSVNGEEVADGGFLINYNKPYGDIYMGVKDGHRGKGYGSFIVQELKKEVYKAGRVPAARTNPANVASKATLLKAGFKVCGARLKGTIRT